MKPIFFTSMILTALATAGGCGPTNLALFSSNADPSYTFAEPGELEVRVQPMVNDVIRSPDQATLEERILVEEVRNGLRQAGFRVLKADSDTAPDLVFFCQLEEAVETYNSYDRIPVTDTSVATIRTRRGYRTYYQTVHSDVIVPTIRQYSFTRLTLAAVRQEDLDHTDASSVSIDRVAVWIAAVRANGSKVMADRVWQVTEAIWLWGKTDDLRLDYLPEKQGSGANTSD